MNPALAPEEEAFRLEVVEFLRDYQDLGGFFHREGEYDVGVRALYRRLGEKGWLSLTWPKELGGLELPPVYEFLLWDEMAYARAARPPLGSGIVAHTIISHGTPDQRARFLPGLRAATTMFSLGYSEPEAGSDLGRVRTRAVLDGDAYVLDGEKRWTSGGHRADYLWMLCRTGTLESRSKGLSLFVVDRTSPGISVWGVPTLDGERFNEIRFDRVRVPVENRIGAENEAWALITAALATERHVQFPPSRCRRDFEDLVAWARANGRAEEPVVRQRLTELAVGLAEAQAHGLLMLSAVEAGRPAAVEAARNKLAGSELAQQIARTALDLGASDALVSDTWLEFLWRQSLCESIGGGTSEIMRGVIARTALGLGASR